MRRETHRRIVKAIAQELGLSRDQRRVLVRVASNFDSIDRRRRKSKRHHGYSACYRVEDYTRLGRKRYLQGCAKEALWYLGAALHLAQDTLIPSPRGWRGLHDRIERELTKLSVPRRTIEEALSEAESPLTEYAGAIGMLRGFISEPIEDSVEIMDVATRISTMLAYAVLGPPAPPQSDLTELRRLKSAVEKSMRDFKEAHRAHKPYVKRAHKVLIIGLILSLIASAASVAIVPKAPPLASLSVAAIPLILSAIRAYKIVRRDARYYVAEKKYKIALRDLKEYMKRIKEWYLVERNISL